MDCDYIDLINQKSSKWQFPSLKSGVNEVEVIRKASASSQGNSHPG